MKNKKNVIIVSAILIISIIVAILYTYFYVKPLYKTTAKIELVQDRREIAEILPCDEAIKQVAEKVKLEDKEVKKAINTTFDRKAKIINVYVNYENNEQSLKIAKWYLIYLKIQLKYAFNVQHFKVIEEPKIAEEPCNINHVKDILVAIGIGLIISYMVVRKGNKKNKEKVYVNGYLYNNLGDDLFLDILSNRYPNTLFVTISRYYKNDKMKIYSNKFLCKILQKFRFLRKEFVINRCSKIISIGGSNYIEGKSKDRTKEFENKDYYILGSNFGPYQTEKYYNKMYKYFENAQDVCFRDKYSYNLFKNLPNVRYAPDIVFSLKTDDIKITNRKRVIISVISCEYKIGKYQEEYENKIIEMIKFFKNKEYEVCLMSFCKLEKDEEAINRILKKLDKKVDTYYYEGNTKEALSVLADSQIIAGSRFHSNILGIVLGKTIIPLIYDNKTYNALESIGYNGKMIFIKDIEKFDCQKDFSDEDLKFKFNVDKIKGNLENQFKVLDNVLEK